MSKVRIPVQPRSKNTREKITKAALKLFSQKGIHSTTTNEIAKKAGVATGSFYAYFKNKQQLLLELLEDFLNSTFMFIWKDLSLYDVNNLSKNEIRAIILQVFKAYDVAPGFMSQAFALRYTDPEINRIFERERQREISQIMGLMESNKDRLSINDPYATAIILHNAVESIAHTAKFIGGEIEEERLIDEMANLIFDYFSSNV